MRMVLSGMWLMVGLLVVVAMPAVAGESAEEIIKKANDGRAAGNSIQTMQLVKHVKDKTTSYTLEVHTRHAEEQVASRAEFTAPDELAGVVLLSIANEGADTETWMYMPAGGSLNSISGSKRSGKFMGTDFSYEDLDIGDADAGSHNLIGEEQVTVAGQSYACHRIETTPRADLETAYGKLITWVQTGNYVPRQILLHNEDGVAIKKMTFEKVETVGNTTLPTLIRMENLGKGTSTTMEVTAHQLDVPADQLPDSLFDPDALVAP